MGAGVGNTVAPLFRGGEVVGENTSLRQENDILKAKILFFEEAIKGYEAYPVFTENVRATVIAWPPKIPYDTLILSLDTSAHAITEGMLVFAYDVLPIGKISRVYDGHAEVALFTTPNQETDVWVGADRMTAILMGHGGGYATIVLPNSAPVLEGDAVLYPHNGGTPLGTIATKKVNESTGLTTYTISFPLNSYSVGWVTLISL